MTKRLAYGVLTAVLAVNLFLGAQMYWVFAETAEKDDIYQNLELFTRALERVRKDYVDGEDLTYKRLIHDALRGMLSNLDPHSEFLDMSRFDELREDTEGAFGGVGLVVGLRGDRLTVVAPMEDTPAFKAGIMKGDEILKINGQEIERVGGLPEAVRQLRGQPGTEVSLTLRRPHTDETREVTLARAVIKVDTVKDLNGERKFPLGEDGIGYVRLTQFGEHTTQELEEALGRLAEQSRDREAAHQPAWQSLVIDLRGNPGGLLDQAVKVCEKFLPRNQVIVSTEGRRAEEREEYRTSRDGRYTDLSLAVLVNSGSASASEIVAACLQDSASNGVVHAVIIGERTFGKGSVQKIIPFPNGDALRLTTAKYYSPNRRVIHLRGVDPDVAVEMSEEEEEALFYRSRGGIETAPENRQGSLAKVRDVQLERALEVLRSARLVAQRSPASRTPPAAAETREARVR